MSFEFYMLFSALKDFRTSVQLFVNVHKFNLGSREALRLE
jgi:hypothetical protein